MSYLYYLYCLDCTLEDLIALNPELSKILINYLDFLILEDNKLILLYFFVLLGMLILFNFGFKLGSELRSIFLNIGCIYLFESLFTMLLYNIFFRYF